MKHLISVFLIFLAFTSKVSAQTPANDAAMYKIILPAYSEYASVKLRPGPLPPLKIWFLTLHATWWLKPGFLHPMVF